MEKSGVVIIEGHVQGLSNTRSFGELGIPVYVIDTGYCLSKYSKYCTKFFLCPPYNSDELADFLIDLAVEYGLKNWLLFPSNDHAVFTISRNKKRLQKYYNFLIPDLDSFFNIYDKSRLLKIASRCGVHIPATKFYDEQLTQEKSLNFPVITKGCYGLEFYKKTGKKAFLANNQDELNKQLQEISGSIPLDKTMTQVVVSCEGESKTVSFAAFSINGDLKTFWMGQKLREHPERFGTATFAKCLFVEELIHSSKILLQELNYSGVCEIEYIKDPNDGKYKLIEINPRTWLWVELAKASGINFPKITYDHFFGNLNEHPETYKLNLYWYNPITDFVYSIIAILRRKLTLGDYFLSMRKKKINALSYKNDNKPVFMYIILLLKFLKNR